MSAKITKLAKDNRLAGVFVLIVVIAPIVNEFVDTWHSSARLKSQFC
jgi:hypothetical protein